LTVTASLIKGCYALFMAGLSVFLTSLLVLNYAHSVRQRVARKKCLKPRESFTLNLTLNLELEFDVPIGFHQPPLLYLLSALQPIIKTPTPPSTATINHHQAVHNRMDELLEQHAENTGEGHACGTLLLDADAGTTGPVPPASPLAPLHGDEATTPTQTSSDEASRFEGGSSARGRKEQQQQYQYQPPPLSPQGQQRECDELTQQQTVPTTRQNLL